MEPMLAVMVAGQMVATELLEMLLEEEAVVLSESLMVIP